MKWKICWRILIRRKQQEQTISDQRTSGLLQKSIAGTIAILFNESLQTEDLPEEIKLGHVIPIRKPGKTDTSLPSSYRGITLTSILSCLQSIKHVPSIIAEFPTVFEYAPFRSITGPPMHIDLRDDAVPCRHYRARTTIFRSSGARPSRSNSPP